MTDTRRPLIAGNWKMNGLKASMSELAAIWQGSGDVSKKADLLICPPATLLFTAAGLVTGSQVAIGAQDCHPAASGAHTGDISAEMIADTGASHVIVGHSERRADHGEPYIRFRRPALMEGRVHDDGVVAGRHRLRGEVRPVERRRTGRRKPRHVLPRRFEGGAIGFVEVDG